MPRQEEEVLEYDDFLEWTVWSLNYFISLRGLKKSGKKSELDTRAFGAYKLNVPVTFSQKQIYWPIEYSQRWTLIGIKSDPNKISDDALKDNVKEWPEDAGWAWKMLREF